MVRFEFVFKKDCVTNCYAELERLEHEFELRYGAFHNGSTRAEIITSDEGKGDIEAVLTKFGINYELERVL